MNRSARACALTAAALTSTLLAATLLAPGATAAATHRATVVVHTTAKHKVVAPATTRPGVARFTNTGTQPIFLVTPRHTAGKATLARDLNADTARGMIKDFIVADTLPANATTYLRLARGTYFLADTSREEFTAASIRSIRVAGTKANATVPEARAVTVTSRNTLTTPSRIATRSQLRIRNSSTHLQEVVVARVPTKVTAAALQAFLAKPRLNDLFTVVSGPPEFLALLSPKGLATSSHHSGAGRYLLLNLPLTRSSAEPHLAVGQVRLVTVT